MTTVRNAHRRPFQAGGNHLMQHLRRVAFTAFIPAVAHGQESPPRGFTIDTLGRGVYAFVRKEPIAYGMQSNSMLVVGNRYAAVVDAQMNRPDTREVIAAIRSITPLPVRFVINTHCHDDHVTGNVEYQRAFPAVEFVASAAMASDMVATCAKNRASFLAAGAGTLTFLDNLIRRGQSYVGGPMPDDERDAHRSYARLVAAFLADSTVTVVGPTRTFERELALDLGGRSIDVLFLGAGHSLGDAIVRVPEVGAIAAGDLVMWPVPFVGSTSRPGDFAETLNRLLALRPAIILPGHGPVLRSTDHIAQTSRMLQSIRDQVAAGVARGDSLPALRRAVDIREFRMLFAGDSKLRQGMFDFYVTSSAIPAEFHAQRAKRP